MTIKMQHHVSSSSMINIKKRIPGEPKSDYHLSHNISLIICAVRLPFDPKISSCLLDIDASACFLYCFQCWRAFALTLRLNVSLTGTDSD